MSIKRFMNKKVVAIGLAAGITLGGAGAAFAYFTSTGSGTGQGAVGTSGNWNVVAAPVAGGPIFPGSGSETITYTVTNGGSGAQALNAAAASVASSGGNITQSGVPVSGCLAADFTATAATPASGLLTSIAGGAHTTDIVTVTMTDSGVNQDACQGKTPDVTLAVS